MSELCRHFCQFEGPNRGDCTAFLARVNGEELVKPSLAKVERRSSGDDFNPGSWKVAICSVPDDPEAQRNCSHFES